MNASQRESALSRIASLVISNTDTVVEDNHFTRLPYGTVKPPKAHGADPTAYIKYIYAVPSAVDGDGDIRVTTSTHFTNGKERSFLPVTQDYDITEFGDLFIEKVLGYLEKRNEERLNA